jgi:cytoskeletal protein CcmA (bactofilin family)
MRRFWRKEKSKQPNRLMQMFQSNRKPDTATPPPAPPPPNPLGVSPDRPIAAAPVTRTGDVLSSGVSIKGDLTFRNELLIDGEVEGTIKSSGTLTIGQHAHIRADITAAAVTIHGTVNGNVSASERCVLEPGATVRGDIEAPRLALDENATFLGNAKIAARRT